MTLANTLLASNHNLIITSVAALDHHRGLNKQFIMVFPQQIVVHLTNQRQVVTASNYASILKRGIIIPKKYVKEARVNQGVVGHPPVVGNRAYEIYVVSSCILLLLASIRHADIG
jgi:hypothetical protein